MQRANELRLISFVKLGTMVSSTDGVVLNERSHTESQESFFLCACTNNKLKTTRSEEGVAFFKAVHQNLQAETDKRPE